MERRARSPRSPDAENSPALKGRYNLPADPSGGLSGLGESVSDFDLGLRSPTRFSPGCHRTGLQPSKPVQPHKVHARGTIRFRFPSKIAKNQSLWPKQFTVVRPRWTNRKTEQARGQRNQEPGRNGVGLEQAAHGHLAWKIIRHADDIRTLELSLVARAFQPAGSRNFPVPCSVGSLGTGDWKIPRTRGQDSTVELNRRQRREGTAPTRTAAHKDPTPSVKPACGRSSTEGPLPPLAPLPPVQ